MSGSPESHVALVGELGFAPIDAVTAIGEAGGVPAAATLLSDDSPGLMLQWRCNSGGTQADMITELLAGLGPEQARMSVENGAVWLSLYDVRGLTAADLKQLLEHVGTTIQTTDLALPAGCLQCGTSEGAHLLAAAGRPTRLCPACLTNAVERQQADEADLNAPSLSATLGLPAAVSLAAGSWAMFWLALDALLDWAGVKVIELDEFAILVMIALIGGTGYGIGWPLGAALRRPIALGRAPIRATLLFAGFAVVAGEILYLAAFVLIRFGVFDLGAAARWVGPFVAQYTPFWIICKLLVVAAVVVSCVLSAGTRRSAALDV